MRLRILRNCAGLIVLALLGTSVLHAQAAVEYGIMTGSSAATATGAPRIPFPNIAIPGGSSNATAPGVSGPAGVAAGTAESAAKANLQFFQSHAGPDSATIAIHATPEHASVWIDGKYLGSAPIADLKLAPGRHQALLRAPTMQESTREFDLSAKQAQSLDFALKSPSQNQVVVHWPSQAQQK